MSLAHCGSRSEEGGRTVTQRGTARASVSAEWVDWESNKVLRVDLTLRRNVLLNSGLENLVQEKN